jgi:hypothetical protein
MLLDTLYPDASKLLLMYVLTHDVAERWTGDAPWYAKQMFAGIASGMEEAEELIHVQMKFIRKCHLSETELRWAKAVDMLELFLWCQDQLLVGNRNVHVLLRNIGEWTTENMIWIPTPVFELLTKDYSRYKRSYDLLWKGKRSGPRHGHKTPGAHYPDNDGGRDRSS